MQKKKVARKSVEGLARSVRRRTNIQHVLLHTVATAGVLSFALLAPNALHVLRMFDGGKARKMDPRYLFGTAFEKLILKKWVIVERTATGKHITLSSEGRQALARMVSRRGDDRVHRRWDKRWRMVIYDIKEGRRQDRVRLQRALAEFGFYKLQDSVWVYPYDCEALLILLKSEFRLGYEVLYIVSEQIEGDKRLRAHFGLQ